MTNLKNTSDLAIPLGALILVTGASGYIGSNVVKEALDAGFKVRGTTRSQEKAEKTKEIFENNPNYETVLVADMGQQGAFDDAVKGVDAIIHVASDMTFGPDPRKVIPPVVQAAVSIMESATKEPKVKRFVYTSSSTAATYPIPNKKFHINKHTWNTDAEQYVDMQPPYDENLGFPVYGASKFKAEQAVWKFVKDNDPSFVVNVVLPNANMGRLLYSPGATGALVNKAYHGELLPVPPQYMVNVADDARIHLAATIDKTVANDRIYAFDTPFNWTVVLNVLKKLRPNKKFVDPDPDEPADLSTIDNEQGAELLRKWWGQDGYTGLEKTIEQNIANEA